MDPLKTAAGRELARQQIRRVVRRFFAATERKDPRALCSLFSHKGLGRVGGATACRDFFEQALSTQRKSNLSQLHISRVAFAEHGEVAEVLSSGLRLFELESSNGRWVIDRAPGL